MTVHNVVQFALLSQREAEKVKPTFFCCRRDGLLDANRHIQRPTNVTKSCSVSPIEAEKGYFQPPFRYSLPYELAPKAAIPFGPSITWPILDMYTYLNEVAGNQQPTFVRHTDVALGPLPVF
jgi:hypothetical protein